ncbi:MAG: M23 family metallopeptidase, partial [Betaproteobacteria bacterium]|nr:M23 family metallopeptidase [Betaproteobacteria bacterium]
NMLREKVQSTELGKGGPLLAPKLSLPFFRAPLNQAIGQTASDIEQLEGAVYKINQTWKSQIEWLESIPNGLPISGNFHFTSGFGIRNDPFTGSLAMHEGIDFSADPGTSVLAAAAGKVVRSAFDPNFGNVVEIQHAEGFLTRYAHLRTRQVAVNAVVARGTQLGEVGNTGRSTGAHLHFEIFRDERVMNPMQVLTYRNH